MVIALAGNKADLEARRKVEFEEAHQYAEDNDILHMETSAKTAVNVKDLFVAIAKRLPKNPPQPEREAFPITASGVQVEERMLLEPSQLTSDYWILQLLTSMRSPFIVTNRRSLVSTAVHFLADGRVGGEGERQRVERVTDRKAGRKSYRCASAEVRQ